MKAALLPHFSFLNPHPSILIPISCLSLLRISMTLSRIRPIAVKEFRQISRDRRTLGVLLLVPAFMLVMFGYALNFDVRRVPLAVCDQDRSRTSREFAESLLRSEYFDLKARPNDPREIDGLMGREEARIALVIPQDFSERLLSGREATVQVLVDGANASAASTAVGYIGAMVQDYSAKVSVRAQARGPGIPAPIDYRPRVWYNPELKSAKFLVPGLIGFILMITAVVSTALSVVREKEQGAMEQIVVSPIRPAELILGKTVPYVLISLVATAIVLLVSSLLFDVVVKGSYPLLFGVTLLFLAGALGLGLLISTVADSQQVAFQMAILATMLPTFLLSGFVFPIRNMPLPVQAITYLVPSRYFLVALRSIILKGAGLSAFYDQAIFLLAFAALTLGVSSARLRRIL